MRLAITLDLDMAKSAGHKWKGGPLTQSMENYLKAIFEIQEWAERASTSSIAVHSR